MIRRRLVEGLGGEKKESEEVGFPAETVGK